MQNSFSAGPMPDPLIKAPFPQVVPAAPTLMLNQVEGWDPVREFTDSANVRWILTKAASDSTRDIPDPKTVQFVGCWNHVVPDEKLKPKIYVYVVEALRPPRVGTEAPAMIMYQWFSTIQMDFNPAMITDREWLKANVYAAPVIDSRVSKLMAICKMQSAPQTQEQAVAQQAEQDKPIKVEGLADASSGNMQGNKKQSRERQQA